MQSKQKRELAEQVFYELSPHQISLYLSNFIPLPENAEFRDRFKAYVIEDIMQQLPEVH